MSVHLRPCWEKEKFDFHAPAKGIGDLDRAEGRAQGLGKKGWGRVLTGGKKRRMSGGGKAMTLAGCSSNILKM